jgi:hypothetical protein
MPTIDVPIGEWPEFLDTFSRQHSARSQKPKCWTDWHQASSGGRAWNDCPPSRRSSAADTCNGV